MPLNALVSVPVKGLEFAPAFGPSIDGVVIDPGDPDDQDFTLQVDTINTLNNILMRKDVVSKLSRYFRLRSFFISSYFPSRFPPFRPVYSNILEFYPIFRCKRLNINREEQENCRRNKNSAMVNILEMIRCFIALR